MWRRTALTVAVVLTLAVRSRSLGQDDKCSRLLISELNWVRFDVVMGRIVVVTNRAKQDCQRVARDLPSGGCESLSVCIDRGLTSVQYSRESPSENLTLSVMRRDSMEARGTWTLPAGQQVTVTYWQMPGQDVRVTERQEGQDERIWTAPSVWHLLATQPELRGTRIVDLLRVLRSDWDPARDADRIVALLECMEPWQLATTTREVEQLVQQLADGDFQVRQWADRELRSRGRAVICLLDGLDHASWDCEQRLRVREIRRFLTGQSGDTPERVAAWLVNDTGIWLALLGQEDLRRRQVAHAHLVRIVARPVDFQPDADSAVRSQQLIALRSRLALR